MTTPFASLEVMTKYASAAPDVSRHSTALVLHPFAQLDPFVKEAGWGQDMIDGAWNNTMKPMGQAIGKTVGGIGNAIGGVGKNVWEGVSALPRTAFGAIQGGIQGAQNGGGLGDFAKGFIDGGWNSASGTVDRMWNNGAQALGGVGSALAGGAETLGRVAAAPAMAAGGALAGGATGAWNRAGGLGGMVQKYVAPHMQGAMGQGAVPPGMQTIPPGQTGSIMHGPPAPGTPANPTAAPGTIAPGQNNLLNNMQPASGGGPGLPWNQPPVGAGSAGFNPGAPPNMGGSAPRPAVGTPGSAPRPANGYTGPTNADISRTMGGYTPGSPLDERKASRIREMWQQNGGRVSPNQVYADSAYNQIKSGSEYAHIDQILTPFAVYDLRKEAAAPAAKLAGGIAGWLRGALQSGAKGLNRGSRMAKATAGRAAKAEVGAAEKARAGATSAAGDLPALPSKRQAFDDAYAGAGNVRQGLANAMGNAGLRIDASPGLQKVINYGAPAAAAGGIFYGGNRMGHNSGMTEGLDRGFDTGADYGIQATLANMPKDPGFFGRIADVFTGQQAGPQAYDIQALLDANKSKILQQLRTA